MLSQLGDERGSSAALTTRQLRSEEWSGPSMVFPAGVEIYGEGEPADYLYRIASGAVRTYTVLADGRRKIGGFYLRGDILGLGDILGVGANSHHVRSAEAIIESRMLVIKRGTLIRLAEHDRDVARRLWELSAEELRRLRAHGLLLIRTSLERVAALLLDLAQRSGSAAGVVELPMSRLDIADYLGLTIETISRTLAELRNRGAIEIVGQRRVLLHNRSVLLQLTHDGGSRGSPPSCLASASYAESTTHLIGSGYEGRRGPCRIETGARHAGSPNRAGGPLVAACPLVRVNGTRAALLVSANPCRL